MRNEKRPSWIALHRISENHEPEVFKLRFIDWQSLSPTYVVPRVIPPKVDVCALYSPHPLSSVTSTTAEMSSSLSSSSIIAPIDYATATILITAPTPAGLTHMDAVRVAMADADAALSSRPVSWFVFEKGNSGSGERRCVKVEDWEVGHLCSGDAYVALAVYDKKAPSGTEVGFEDETDESAAPIECVIYFWVGKRASKLALSTFKFHSQAEVKGKTRFDYLK